MKRLSIRLGTAVLAFCALAIMGACGLKGDLATPGPLWGEPQTTAVAERELPNARSTESNRIVFTRDDVDLFRRGGEAEDPFAEDEDEKPPTDAPANPG